MKKIAIFFTAFLLTALFLLPGFAVSSFADTPHVYDEAGLLSSWEVSDVEATLAQYSKECNCFIAVMAVDYSSGGFETAAYNKVEELRKTEGDDIYLLYIDMGTRDYRVESHGIASKSGNSDVREYLEDAFVSPLSNGNYARAFKAFGKSACEVVGHYRETGQSFTLPKASYPVFLLIVGMLIVGLIAGLIYTSSLKKQLKSVEKQTQAANYVKAGSLNVTVQKDLFLYTAITKTPRPKSNSSSSSGGGFSGGGSSGHGGFSGKF